MPVRLAVDGAGNVTNVYPAGIPNMDQLGAPTCAMCGADDFAEMCPGAPPAEEWPGQSDGEPPPDYDTEGDHPEVPRAPWMVTE